MAPLIVSASRDVYYIIPINGVFKEPRADNADIDSHLFKSAL